MNSRIMKIAMIVMISLMTAGSFAYAQHGQGKGHGKKDRQGERLQKAIERLNLTADQQARIKAIRDNFKTANAATIEQIKALRVQMQEARKSGNKEQAQAIHEQMKAKMESMRPARQQMIEQIKAVLTAEQRAELEKMIAEKKAKKGEKKDKKAKGDRQTGKAQSPGQAKKSPAID
jgi:periplasmic protein CpxP/Spy